jgi:hypothetical protein
MQVAELRLAGEPAADTTAAAIAAALAAAPVVHVSGGTFPEDATPFWTGVIGRLGAFSVEGEDGVTGRRDQSVWTDIRYDPDRPHTFRHHNVAQPLHTDGAYNAPAADVVMFWCQHAAPAGGETLFADAGEVAAIARLEEPALYAELTGRPVLFRKLDGGGRAVPVLDCAADGVRATWNYYRVADGQGEAVDRLRESFRDWLERRIVAGGACRPVRLARHEAVFFRDDRVLHGRNAYAASRRDDRLLWKAAFFMDGA